MTKNNNAEIKSIIERIEKLEYAIFENKSKTTVNKERSEEDFSGATGGIRFLVSQKFFNEKRSLSDVKNELSKHNYHYSTQAAQTGLSRLSKPGGPLVTFKESGKKVYAKRK